MADKIVRNDFERTKYGPKGEGQTKFDRIEFEHTKCGLEGEIQEVFHNTEVTRSPSGVRLAHISAGSVNK